jgi:hypothetical protein
MRHAVPETVDPAIRLLLGPRRGTILSTDVTTYRVA